MCRVFLKSIRYTGMILAGAGIAIALLETGTRLFGLAPGFAPLGVHTSWGEFKESSNPDLGYEPRPGSADINSNGYRDRIYSSHAPPGTQRIVVVGDSIAWGWYRWSLLPLEQTFTKQLEQRIASLQEGSPAIPTTEVVNLAVSGYDTLKEAAWLESKGLALNPDIVLVAYCLNDEEDSSAELDLFGAQKSWGERRSVIASGLFDLMRYSHLARIVWQRLQALRLPTQPQSASRVAKGLSKISQLAEARGFVPVIVIFPVFGELRPQYPFKDTHRRIAHAASKFGFHVIDLLTAFQEASHDRFEALELQNPDYYHPNAFGHRLAAQTVADELRPLLASRNKGLLQRPVS